jgi:hypothetical protein
MNMKTVHICIASGDGRVIIDVPASTRDTHCAVTDVPSEMQASFVINQVSKLAFWPWPKTLSWPDIAFLPEGTFIKGDAEKKEEYP